MAGKISELTALLGAQLAANDLFEVSDVSATLSKSITAAELLAGLKANGLGVLDGADFWSETMFANVTQSNNSPIVSAGAINSGTTSLILTTALDGYHIAAGGVLLRASASANSGYYLRDGQGAQMWFGSRAMKFQCNAHFPTSLSNALVRLGFIDTQSASDATDGAYFEISGTTVSAKTAKAASRSTHATTGTLAADTWYTFDVEVDAAAANARLRVTRDSDGASILDVTNTTNIPNTGSNGTGIGVVGVNTAGSLNAPIIALNRLGFGTLAAFNRVRG